MIRYQGLTICRKTLTVTRGNIAYVFGKKANIPWRLFCELVLSKSKTTKQLVQAVYADLEGGPLTAESGFSVQLFLLKQHVLKPFGLNLLKTRQYGGELSVEVLDDETWRRELADLLKHPPKRFTADSRWFYHYESIYGTRHFVRCGHPFYLTKCVMPNRHWHEWMKQHDAGRTRTRVRKVQRIAP